jgi:LmbE family N-acetylglucosaminyl deacetylase
VKNILVLVAHADDESLGAGGYIPKLVQQGHCVSVVVVSTGVVQVRGVTQDNREDALKACRILGVDKPVFLGFEDQKFDTYPISEIANRVSELDLHPQLMITHAPGDLNKDHRIVCEVAKIVGRPKKGPVTILGCEVPNTTAWNGKSFHANYYVDISSTIDHKIKAFSAYHHELQDYPHPWSTKGLKVLSEFRGMEAGCHHAEAYEVLRAFDEGAM